MEQADTRSRGPVRFERTFPVRDADIDDLGHVNNLVYLRWVQAVARAHWETAAAPEHLRSIAWVVVRHEIDYLRPAHSGDEIIARTWVEAWKGATSDRRTELLRSSDGEVLARARTVWCALNADTGRPKRVSSRMRAPFLEG